MKRTEDSLVLVSNIQVKNVYPQFRGLTSSRTAKQRI